MLVNEWREVSFWAPLRHGVLRSCQAGGNDSPSASPRLRGRNSGHGPRGRWGRSAQRASMHTSQTDVDLWAGCAPQPCL